MDRDTAILLAAPATFLDKKSKASSLFEALQKPPEYPLSKALTADQARVILDTSHRSKSNFMRFEDKRTTYAGKLGGWVFYYVDDPKYGDVRWALKNKEIQLQMKRGGRWANTGTAMFLVEAALKVLEAVAKRTKDDVLASAVAGWQTTREVASERGVSKREAKELVTHLRGRAIHDALVADPNRALRFASLLLRFKHTDDKSTAAITPVRAAIQNDIANEVARLQKKYFRFNDIPQRKLYDIYSLDKPPAIAATSAHGLQLGERPGSIVLFGPTQFTVDHGGNDATVQLLDTRDSYVIDPKVTAVRGTLTPEIAATIARVLRGYGFDDVGFEGREIERELKAAGYGRGQGDELLALPVVRGNPRRRAARSVRRNPAVTENEIRSVWPEVGRWIGGGDFRPGVDWSALFSKHDDVFDALRRKSPMTAYRAAHGRPDEFRYPSAWTLDRELAWDLVADCLVHGPERDVRVLLQAEFAPRLVWFVVPDLQRAADEAGAKIRIDSQEWQEVVVATGAYKLTAADKKRVAATKKAWRSIAKLEGYPAKHEAAKRFTRENYGPRN